MAATTNQTLVKILGGRSEVQIAPLGETSGNKLLPAFDSQNVQHLMTTIEEPINGWKTFVHTFRAKDQNYVDALLQPFLSQQKSPPLVSIRFGLVSGSESNWRPWEDHVVIGHRVAVPPDQQSGPLVTVRTADRLWLFLANKKARAHRGSMSTIIGNLWKEIGGDKAMIEDTLLTGHANNSGIWYQAFEPTWSFIMRTVLPLARNAAGMAGYRLFIKDNVLRFHSPGYGAIQPKKLLYTFGTPGFDRLNVEDRFIEMSGGAGAAGTRRAIYDPITGEAKLLESDPTKLLRLAGSRPNYINWDYRASHVGGNLSSAEDARNQQKFSVLSSEAFNLDFTSDKCMDIRVGDVLEIALAPAVTSSSLYSGLWLVNKEVHTLEQGALSSQYIVTRGEFNLIAQKNVISPDSFEATEAVPGIDFVPSTQLNVTNSGQVPSSTFNTGTGVSVPIQTPA
jgi:hypothetical protein